MVALRVFAFIMLIVKPAEIMFTLPLEDLSLTWSFYYANVLLMSGESGSQTTARELNIRRSENRDLLITFNYPGPEPQKSTLIVRNDSGFVREYAYEARQSVDAFTPSVGTGIHFIIPVQEIVGPTDESGRFQVDFYYSDENDPQEQLIGTIVFIQ